MPFKKGQVANPKGRPKEVDTFLKVKSFSECATYARAKAYDAIDALVKNLKDESGSVRNQAAVALLDRAYGKAAQVVQFDDEKPLVVHHVTTDRALLDRYLNQLKIIENTGENDAG